MAAAGNTPVIGLLGAPGAGKSHCARAFASLGCAVIDADELAHEALADTQVLDQLKWWWGPGVVGEDGGADRAAIGNIVFGDRAELARLETLIHPRVHRRREALRQQYRDDPEVRAIVEDCPLLLEKGLERGCDVLVFVDAPRGVRLERLASTRGWDEAELAQREKAQTPLDTKRDRADYVVDGSGARSVTDQARRILSEILHERA